MVSRVQLSATTSRPLVLRQDPDADLSRYTTTGKGKTHGGMTTGDSHMGFKTASTVCPIKSQLIQLKPAPGMRWPRIGLPPPFVHRVRIHEYPAQCRVGYAPIHGRGGWVFLLPRGPRSGPGCAVPVRHHLIDPIRPTRGHIVTSPQGGLYAMPSLCGSA